MIRILDFIIEKCQQFRHYLLERKLPKECRNPWVDGYNKWKNKK